MAAGGCVAARPCRAPSSARTACDRWVASAPPRALLPPALLLQPGPRAPLSSNGSPRPATRVSAGKAAPLAAAATAAAPGAAHPWITATGVPLLEALQALTLEQAAARSLALVAATALGVLLGNKLLGLMGSKLDAISDKTARSSGLGLLAGTALQAVYRPAATLLPLYGLFYALLVIAAFADVLVTRLDGQMQNVLHLCGFQLLAALKKLTQLMQDSSELVLIVFAAWFAIAWKNRVIQALTKNMDEDGSDELNLGRILVPVSNLISWAIVGCSALVSLAAWGINIQPLLAVGSVSTVAIGFAAQSTMQNFVSALSIYTSRPFIVGDRVQLKSLNGSTIAAGVVERIMPMRTVLRGDNRLPLMINNKDVMSLMVVNESKFRRMPLLPKMPLLEADFTLRYKDVDQLPAIEREITAYLQAHPCIDQLSSRRCVLSDLSLNGPVLSVKAMLLKSEASRLSPLRGELLRDVERIIRSHGAFLAVSRDFSQELPPPLPPHPAAGQSGEFGATPAGP